MYNSLRKGRVNRNVQDCSDNAFQSIHKAAELFQIEKLTIPNNILKTIEELPDQKDDAVPGMLRVCFNTFTVDFARRGRKR